jgi:acylphosphatase
MIRLVTAFRYLARGRVQGVGYRYFVAREAETLGVTGFTRNLPDGTVEVVAEGTDDVLARFEERLREGPGFARVEGVERAPLEPRGDRGFHIR